MVLFGMSALVEALRQTGSTPLIEELERVVSDLEQLLSFKDEG